MTVAFEASVDEVLVVNAHAPAHSVSYIPLTPLLSHIFYFSNTIVLHIVNTMSEDRQYSIFQNDVNYPFWTRTFNEAILICNTAPTLIAEDGDLLAATMTDEAALDMLTALVNTYSSPPPFDNEEQEKALEVTRQAWREWVDTRARYNKSTGWVELRPDLAALPKPDLQKHKVSFKFNTQEGGHNVRVDPGSLDGLHVAPVDGFHVKVYTKTAYDTAKKTFECEMTPTMIWQTFDTEHPRSEPPTQRALMGNMFNGLYQDLEEDALKLLSDPSQFQQIVLDGRSHMLDAHLSRTATRILKGLKTESGEELNTRDVLDVRKYGMEDSKPIIFAIPRPDRQVTEATVKSEAMKLVDSSYPPQNPSSGSPEGSVYTSEHIPRKALITLIDECAKKQPTHVTNSSWSDTMTVMTRSVIGEMRRQRSLATTQGAGDLSVAIRGNFARPRENATFLDQEQSGKRPLEISVDPHLASAKLTGMTFLVTTRDSNGSDDGFYQESEVTVPVIY